MKTRQAFNPYLPSWEYVPDAEPHIVDGRVYVYGSHDLFNGIKAAGNADWLFGWSLRSIIVLRHLYELFEQIFHRCIAAGHGFPVCAPADIHHFHRSSQPNRRPAH